MLGRAENTVSAAGTSATLGDAAKVSMQPTYAALNSAASSSIGEEGKDLDLRIQLTDRFRELAVLTEILDERNKRLIKAEEDVRHLRAEVDKIKSELSRNRKLFLKAKNDRDQMQQSLSWRMTAPFRALTLMLPSRKSK